MMNQQKKTRHDSDEYGDNNDELKNVAEFARPSAKVEEFAVVALNHLRRSSVDLIGRHRSLRRHIAYSRKCFNASNSAMPPSPM